MAFHGNDFYFTLWEFDQDVLRQKIKYDENLTEETIESPSNFQFALGNKNGQCLSKNNIINPSLFK
jgi:hypothetical protein